MELSSLKSRFEIIQNRIRSAAIDAGRDPASVTLIAVTKTVPIDLIREAYDLGHRDFGESRLKEAQQKIEELPKDIRWHFIGKLQSNKAKKVAQLFKVIHTLENEGQLLEIQKANLDEPIDCFIEINVASEAQKSGITPEQLRGFLKSVLQYKCVRFRGLMSIGPANPNSELMRPYFKNVAEWNCQVNGEQLSLGMSNDFEVAIHEGSTHVRVGSALFGERNI